jgi:3-hydroxyacyl-[acyl-carrier-protein] dehydratase
MDEHSATIHSAIPHREPFLLVDEIVARDERRIHCRQRFTGQEWFFAGHYPGFPLVPGVLLCEAAMQAGAILLSAHLQDTAKTSSPPSQGGAGGGSAADIGPSHVPVATRMNDVRFKRMVRPGETIDLEVELVERLADAFFLKAKVSVDGAVAARLEFACTLAPLG